MGERTYTEYERELAVWAAERDGDKATAEAFGCSEATIRSWRHRAERKVVDRRAERADAGGNDEDETAGALSIVADLADVEIATDDFDTARGCYRKIAARARGLEQFEIGNAFMSRGELRELRAPGAAGLAVGDVVLLGGARYATFGDALWAVAERQDGKLLVRPAKIRRDEKLADDRSRIVAKGREDAPPGWGSEEEYQRQRAKNINEQIDEQDRRMRAAREILTS
jgi:hypothetical protein